MTSPLMDALILGATTHLKPNVAAVGHPVSDAYVALTNLIKRNYPTVDAHLLNIAPHSEERQQQLAAQLNEAGVYDDAEIATHVQHLFALAADQEMS